MRETGLPETSLLLLPRRQLAGCISAAIVRDTRSVTLSDEDRFNHFPATPMVSLTRVFAGETRLVAPGGGLFEARQAAPFAPISAAGPQTRPLASWNPGPVFAISVGFFPDSWRLLAGVSAAPVEDQVSLPVPGTLAAALAASQTPHDIRTFWDEFQDRILHALQAAQPADAPTSRAGAPMIRDWARWLTAKALTSAPGASVRTIERRISRWTGQNRQALGFYAQAEALHESLERQGGGDLAGLAQDTGYADQSHMGRAVKRISGFSPARLNALIASHESFWCYRLLGERF